MNLTDILLILNTPALGAILLWVVKVEKRLTAIETVCRLRNEKCGGV